MNQTLYELTENALNLEALLERIENGEDASILREALDANDGQFSEKVEAYVRMIRNQEALAEMRKQEAKHLRERAGHAENKAEWLRATLKECLEALGRDKMDAGPFSVSIAGNGGKVPLLLDESFDPPTGFAILKMEWDKEKVREALELGEEIPGATLGERGRSLRIR